LVPSALAPAASPPRHRPHVLPRQAPLTALPQLPNRLITPPVIPERLPPCTVIPSSRATSPANSCTPSSAPGTPAPPSPPDFPPPQALRLAGHKRQRQAAQNQGPPQPHVAPPLVVPEPQLGLAQPQAMFHVPAVEPRPKHQAQRRPRRPTGDEVLLLPRPLVPRPDQPVPPAT